MLCEEEEEVIGPFTSWLLARDVQKYQPSASASVYHFWSFLALLCSAADAPCWAALCSASAGRAHVAAFSHAPSLSPGRPPASPCLPIFSCRAMCRAGLLGDD